MTDPHPDDVDYRAARGPMGLDRDSDPFIDSILEDLHQSPTPYHAVARARQLLTDAGFVSIDLDAVIPREPGSYVTVQGGSLVAWIVQDQIDNNRHGFTLVGAHTDSPNLRVKTNPDVVSAGLAQIGMEVYGGMLLNSWLNRDLGLAGRVSVRAGHRGAESRLVDIDEPMLTIPQLAIHLDRDITTNGLKLNRQQHLVPLWTAAAGDSDPVSLRHFLAERLAISGDDILAWDLMAYDLQPPSRLGRHREYIASARIDNLLSTFCATRALAELGRIGNAGPHTTPVLVLYDHEEIGSESATGASSQLLLSLLERIGYSLGADRDQFLTSLNRSIAVSADGAHATHPNYVDKHDPNHNIELNRGVVVKRNANQRYATDALSEAFMIAVCREAAVPLQQYIHRNDLPCGSTIGPITAARLGMPTVDLGAPQLSMHSIRETAGTIDAIYLADALLQAWSTDRC